MPLVCGIKFRGTGKVYHFSPGPLEDLVVGESIIVETARGKEIGEVKQEIHEISDGEIVGNLKAAVRRATSQDLVIAARYREREAEDLERCEQEIQKSGLNMKVVDAEYSFDGSRLTFFFTSDHRVDFRDLVRDLARVFRTRIELRQIGVRDQAKLVGGIGKCGRELCCATWMQEFCPVSIRMAKTQNLPLTPLEISGLCGRLLCCLNYEDEAYREVRSWFPKVGKRIETSIGPARMVGLNIIKELAEIELEDGTRVRVTQAQLAGDEPIQIVDRQQAAQGAVRRALDRAEQEREEDDAADKERMSRPSPRSSSQREDSRPGTAQEVSDAPPRRRRTSGVRPQAARSSENSGQEGRTENSGSSARSGERRRSAGQGSAGRRPRRRKSVGDENQAGRDQAPHTD